MLEKFFVLSDVPTSQLLPVTYDASMVMLSFLVAIASAILAMYTIGLGQSERSSALTQKIAILAGSSTLGVGIWAMHFIGLLSMDFCTTVSFNFLTTALSVLPALFASGVALTLLSRKTLHTTQLISGGALMGAGIGIMHYMGMAAMQMGPLLRYAPGWFLLSLIIAILLAILAVWIRFDLVRQGKLSQQQSILVSGTVLGLAITGMHYASMYGARFIGQQTVESYSSLAHNMQLAILIATATLVVSMLVFSGVTIYRSRQMQQALTEREQQYRTLIANIPGIAFRCQAEGDRHMIFASDAITQVTGWPKLSFLVREVSFSTLMHPDDRTRVKHQIQDALSRQTSYVVEYRITHQDGSERWISESAGGVHDQKGQPLWIDGVMIDITDSKLRAAEYEGIVFAIREALAVAEFDMHGYLLDANENFLQLMGYRLDELQGHHHRMLCHPGEAESQGYQAFWQALNDGNFQSREFCRLAKDGHEVWIQAAYNPILDSDGKPWKVVKLATDLSLRKQMEKDLMDARDKAEQASAAKGMFLANMSHEIRTPMNAIIGFSDVLLQSPLNTQQQKHLSTISHSARSLLRLLNDILDTAKLERGAVELDPEDFSLHALCNDLISTFTLQAEHKGITLSLDYAADCPVAVHGDSLRYRQILTNLLGNAIKFTEVGSVTLSVTQSADRLMLAITDTGIGIPTERLERIFSPFTQADASMARRFGGTGLGTTIAHQLVTLMNGNIQVTSEVGKGSCFTVALPFIPTQSGNAWQQAQKVNLSGLNVLIVDDVPENLELLDILLTKEGHLVTRAHSGKEAIGTYLEGAFDLILMDVQMPGIDGLEATRLIRQWEAIQDKPAVPVIALTASVLSKDREEAIAAGMNGFATKPVDIQALQREIANLLQLPYEETSGTTALPAAIDAPASVIDWETALARWGDRPLLEQMIREFIGKYQTIPDILANSATEDIPALAHKVRGVAANLGLDQITAITHQLEHSELNASTAATLLRTAFATLSDQLPTPAREVTHVNTTESLPTPEIQALLQRLKVACQQAQLDNDAIDSLQKVMIGKPFSDIMQHIEDFDFEAAEAGIDRLISQTLSST